MERDTEAWGGFRSLHPGHTARLLPHCPSPTHQGTEELAQPEEHPRCEVSPTGRGAPGRATPRCPHASYAEEEGQGWPYEDIAV